jgi:hypothetical protein
MSRRVHSNSYSRSRNIVIVLFLILLFGGIGFGCYEVNYGNERNFTATVTEKYIKRKNDHDVYMIVLQDVTGEVQIVQNEDSLMLGKFNSSDVYGRLQVGHKYHIKTVGYRNNFFSMYPNLIVAEEVK